MQETFPYKELIDYWSSRPRYEETDAVSSKSDFVSGSSASELNSRPLVREGVEEGGSGGSGGGENEGGIVGQTYQEWLAAQREDGDDVPPPPYSLEAEEVPVSVAQPQTDVTTHVSTPSPAVPNLPSGLVPVASQENNHSVSVPHQASRPLPTAFNTSSRPQSERQQSYSVNTLASNSHHSYAAGTPHSHSLGHGHGHGHGQQGYPQAQDPVNALANNFGRHGISSTPSQTKVHTQIPSQGSSSGHIQVSPPPLHPAHPAAATVSVSTSGSGHMQASPPPLHPAHPAVAAAISGSGSAASYNHNQRPHTSHGPPSNSRLRSPSQSGSLSHSSSGSSPHMSHALLAGSGQLTLTGRTEQWPPAEWRNDGAPGAAAGPTPQQQRPHSSYGNQNTDANLTRPYTAIASPYSTSSCSSPTLRPHVSTGASTGKPAHDQTRPQLHSPGPSGDVSTGRPTPSPGPVHSPGHEHKHGSGSVSPYPDQGSSRPSHGEHGALLFPANPGPTTLCAEAMTSAYAGHNSTAHSGKVTTQTSYTSQPTHGYKDNYLNTPVHTLPHSPSGQANFRTPTPGPSAYPGKPYNPHPDHGHNTNQGSFPDPLPHGGPPGSYEAPHSHGNTSQPGGFHIPQAQGTEYFNIPQPHAYTGSQHDPYSPAYISPQNPTASYQPPLHHQASFPSPNTSAPGGWCSESSNSSVRPPMIPSKSILNPPYSFHVSDLFIIRSHYSHDVRPTNFRRGVSDCVHRRRCAQFCIKCC